MSKKAECFENAERLFIDKQYNLKKIAEELSISENTVRNWAKEGNWEERKTIAIKARTTFSDDVFKFTQKLMRFIEESIENNEDVPQSKIYLLNSLLDKVQKIKAYEKEVIQSHNEESKTKAKGLSKEAIAEIKREMFGV